MNIAETSEKAIVDKFDLERAPMPLVLAIAPNGAITGGFPTKFEEQQLLDAFATPGTEKLIKSLQNGKLVFVCVQNAKRNPTMWQCRAFVISRPTCSLPARPRSLRSTLATR